MYPISDQNVQNLYPISDQNGSKTIPFGVAHTYIPDIVEYLALRGENQAGSNTAKIIDFA